MTEQRSTEYTDRLGRRHEQNGRIIEWPKSERVLADYRANFDAGMTRIAIATLKHTQHNFDHDAPDCPLINEAKAELRGLVGL